MEKSYMGMSRVSFYVGNDVGGGTKKTFETCLIVTIMNPVPMLISSIRLK